MRHKKQTAKNSTPLLVESLSRMKSEEERKVNWKFSEKSSPRTEGGNRHTGAWKKHQAHTHQSSIHSDTQERLGLRKGGDCLMQPPSSTPSPRGDGLQDSAPERGDGKTGGPGEKTHSRTAAGKLSLQEDGLKDRLEAASSKPLPPPPTPPGEKN